MKINKYVKAMKKRTIVEINKAVVPDGLKIDLTSLYIWRIDNDFNVDLSDEYGNVLYDVPLTEIKLSDSKAI